jgi:hypothetical protein
MDASVVAALHAAVTQLSTAPDKYELRGCLADLFNIIARELDRIDRQNLAELRGSAPMPEHGFTGRPSPRVGAATIEDLLA